MIVFGTRGVTSTKETGPFNCLFCGDQRAYSRKSVRRFFTLYFIPVIPLDEMGNTYIASSSQSWRDLRGLGQ